MHLHPHRPKNSEMTMWDQRYSISEYFYGKLPNQFLSEHVSVIPQGARVLALADGEGIAPGA